MIYNDQVAVEYGAFNIPSRSSYTPPAFKPIPLSADYNRGYIARSFILKFSDDSGHEIDPKLSGQVDGRLYKVYTFNWRIAGSKSLKKTDNIIDDYGVEAQNQQELQRVSAADKVNLLRFYPNLLEYWRGY